MLRFVTALEASILGCTACSGQPAESRPVTDPSGVELEFKEPQTSEQESAEVDDSAEAESPEPSQSDAAQAEPPPKSCSGLPKATCEITLGCAWSTDKKCVAQ